MNKFQKYSSILNYSPVSINDIFQNQELVFYTFLGHFPNRTIRLLSPFRKDKTPGCRFDYFDGLWWFVDNATYKDKLYFNCIEIVMYMYDISFKEAIRTIANTLKIKHSSDYNIYHKKVSEQEINNEIVIKFTYKKWENTNYFSEKYFIDATYLNLQPYYNVVNYWCNTKKDSRLRINRFGKVKDQIAYLFRDNSVKLYFPNANIKWYSNASDDNLFGYHRMGEYLTNENGAIFITSSGKDEMCLNYHLFANSLGVQSESTYTLPEYILWKLKWFNPIYIWMDADPAGYRCNQKLHNFLKGVFPSKEVYQVFHPKEMGNDIADTVANGNNLIKTFKLSEII